ncbi:hypothetical protein Goshw_006115 [Gossypium schwendimanii]|uniref:Uncharacterized protein n=1 Tax=Gossypium schwendimanii TaxID=34291 RepID=A0A7J9LEK1_GOSSC|nr:hypothetical protein [Gossypium schwendimanii]
MEFELVIERIDEGYLERFEERILGFGEVVVVGSYISSHLFLVVDGRSVMFSRFSSLSPTFIATIPNWWWSRLIGTLLGNQSLSMIGMIDLSVICLTDSDHGILHTRHTTWGWDSVKEEVQYWWLFHNHCYWWLGHIYCYWQLCCDTAAGSFAAMLQMLSCLRLLAILVTGSFTAILISAATGADIDLSKNIKFVRDIKCYSTSSFRRA